MMIFMKYRGTDNGFCRVYYTDGWKRKYCFQSAPHESSNDEGVEFYVCTNDGEPIGAHPIKENMRFELPDCCHEIDSVVRDFILKRSLDDTS